jgi:uncharacterized protein YecE (DUF72 family)
MTSVFRLDIKTPKTICHQSYSRLASPVLHTWEWKNIAISESEQALREYAKTLPLDMFYFRQRDFRIYQ